MVPLAVLYIPWTSEFVFTAEFPTPNATWPRSWTVSVPSSGWPRIHRENASDSSKNPSGGTIMDESSGSSGYGLIVWPSSSEPTSGNDESSSHILLV